MGEPVIQLGRYALHAEIAAGGMATVYLGRLHGAVGFGRTVAIKRLHPHLAKDTEFVSMFLDEARLAARVQHPNVVPTLDVVTSDGELFLVLEYVRGESLSALIRAAKAAKEPLKLPIVAALVTGMLHGLHAAHEATDEQGAPLNIVHRDVSPQNVIIGVDGIPRLLDFGVAKAELRLQTTREGQLKGKLAYMPPEQLNGVVSRATDIYAAGVVLWEALTNERLFRGETEAQIMNMIVTMPIPAPSTRNPLVPKELDAIALKALSRSPGDRFATAEEMAAAIERVVAPAPARDVANVLERYLAESIDRRKKIVADIESASSVPGKGELLRLVDSRASGDLPSASSMPQIPPSPESAPNALGQVSTASLTLSQAPPPRSRSSLVLLLLMLPVLAGGIAAGAYFARSAPPATPASSAVTSTATSTGTASAIEATTAPPPPPTASASAPSASASTSSRPTTIVHHGGQTTKPIGPPSSTHGTTTTTSDPNAIPEGRR